MNNLALTCTLASMACLLYLLYQYEARKCRSGREALFNACSGLLADVSQSPGALGFPTLRGNYQGYQVILAAQVDTMATRKVPPLWLTVTVIGRQPIQGSLAVLVRPQNTEFYSPAWEWDNSVPIPPGWPPHAIARYRNALAPLALLDRFVPELFADDKVKELLVTPGMVRITYLAKQADRGEYMLMRNAVFDGAPIQREAVATLLESAAGLRQQLEGMPD
jgi:hypothetical protein